MKDIILYSILCISIISCSEKNLPIIIDNFVDDAELNCGTYSVEEWDVSCEKFKKLIEEFSNSKRPYTETEKQIVARAIGRYDALLLKQEITDEAEYFNEVVKILPDYLDGLTDGLTNRLRNNFSKDIQESDNPISFEELGRKLDQLLN